MIPKRLSRTQLFINVILIVLLWSSSQAVASDFRPGLSAGTVEAPSGITSERVQQAQALPSPNPASEAVSGQDWFLVSEDSQWTDQEMFTVKQIMDRTWAALAGIGLDGQQLLAGYRFVRLQAEFVPGEERLLAIVDHQKTEIVLADGAFKRLHGFYIYHELGHAVDNRLGRAPSEAYHQVAGTTQMDDRLTWLTKDGYWLRYPGRDDREEATADAFAWWVMDQAGQPQPFFPGTPVTTDYADVAQSIEDALRTAVASARS